MDNKLSLPLGHAVSLSIATLGSILSLMAAGNASQTTLVQITHFHVLFCTDCTCAILIPVKVLLVTWCVFINFKQFNWLGLDTFLGFSSF